MISETTIAPTVLDTSLDDLLNQHFAGRVVRKDLTKLVKEGANVPVYVLEYLLGTYCASNDEEVIPLRHGAVFSGIDLFVRTIHADA